MGGRPPIVGLLAVAVAALCTGEVVTAPPAAAEFRIPGLFEPKRKVIRRKQVFRPTMPNRNPDRVTAGVSAVAVPPPKGDAGEVVIVAGAASEASVALVVAPAAQSVGDADTTEDAETVPAVVDGSALEMPETVAAEHGKGTDRADTDSQTSDPSETAKSTDEPAEEETAATETDETAAPASESRDSDLAGASEETAEDKRQDGAEGESVSVVSADGAENSEATDTDAEAMTEASAVEDEGGVNKTVELAAAEETIETAEAETDVDAEMVEVAPDEAETTVSVAADAPGEPAKMRDHDATVVLEISPPPDDVLKAAADAGEVGTAEDTAAEEGVTASEDGMTSEDETVTAVVEAPDEMRLAALTPPADPVAATPEEDSNELETTAAALDTAPSDDEKVDAEDASEESGSEDSAAEKETVEDADEAGAATEASEPADPENADAETANEADAMSGEESVAEEAAPPPPPAHPIVAVVREKLGDLDAYKNVASSDLESLTAFYGTHEGPPLWMTEIGFTDNAKAAIAEIRKADDWGLDAASFDVPRSDDMPVTDEAQADAEIKMSIAVLSYARDAQIGRLSPSRVSKLFDQHPTLREPKTVLTELAASAEPRGYLTSLHPQHPQLRRLQEALMRARTSAEATGRNPLNDRQAQLIIMNMERWRWVPRSLGNYHVWNNVPEFNVRVMKNEQAIYQEKTIVGQYKYATPFFSASMRNIVFHPNWTVPPTIIKEDLAPKLKRPGGGGFFGSSKEQILRRYGLQASYKGEKINADTVDWDNVNIHAYTFTQEPGPANVLGQFKFNFPNKHAIYMHDTPQRELFAERTRTLSHGCIRVHQPDRLAALLLGQDKGWSMGQVRNLVAQNQSRVIPLNRSVPVHLTYFTAVVDEYGQVNTYGDIYGIDNKMAQKLFDNPASFPVPATPAVAEAAPSPRQTQSRRRSGRSLDSFISGLFGN